MNSLLFSNGFNDNADHIIKFLQFLHPHGETYEVCVIGPKEKKHLAWNNEFVIGYKGKPGTASGYFIDHTMALKIIKTVNDEAKPEGIYVTLNPTNPELYLTARANHRLIANNSRTKDEEIGTITNILIDIDPKRPTGISSTEEEFQEALTVAEKIKNDAMSNGWPEPLLGISGNGGHLIFKTYLENKPENIKIIKNVLEYLNNEYSTSKVEIDISVHNPARLTKVIGTHVRKGENIPERPHRRAKIISMPAEPKILSNEQLKQLSDAYVSKLTTEKHPINNNKRFDFDVEAYLNHYGINVVDIKNHGTGILYCLEECVFDPSHRPNKASIGQAESGKLFYQCFHNSCRYHTWEEARKIISGDDNLKQFKSSNSMQIEDIKIIGDVVSGADLLNIDFPKNKMLIEKIIGHKEATLFCGGAGIGKSVLTLNLGLSLGSQIINSIWGFNITKHVSTLFVQSENMAQATKDRISLISQGSLAFKNGIQNIYFPSLKPDDIRITNMYLSDPNFQSFLTDKIQETGAKLLILDPLISFHNGDENDNVGMRNNLDILTEICSLNNASVIVLHHLGKEYIRIGSFSGRGASSIGDWADNVFLMEYQKKSDMVRVTCQKARNFEKPDEFYLQMNKNLIFERVQQNQSEKTQNIQFVISALNNLGGNANRQIDLIQEIQKIKQVSTNVARNMINKAINEKNVTEILNPKNKKEKGYSIVQGKTS